MLQRMIFPLLVMSAFAASTGEIRALLSNRVDEAKKAVGIVVGTITPHGREYLVRGKTAKDGGELNADSVFEIGSITKVFTSLLLADMVERGELTLEDLRRYAIDNGEPTQLSGKQELYEMIVNQHI